MERSSTEIFNLPQATENSRQFLLLRTDILQSLGAADELFCLISLVFPSDGVLRLVAFTQHSCLAVALSAEVIVKSQN